MCELGRRLREARERKGLTLARAAEALKVRRSILEALEECRFDELPEPALARGYLKRYAQLLDLEPGPLLALYPSHPTETMPPPPARPQGRPRWAWSLLLLLAVGAWLGFRALSPSSPAPPPTTPSSPPPPPPPKQVSLRVNTEPQGARVYLDGFLLGQAPLEVRVEAGERRLRVEAPGYQRYEQVLRLQSDHSLSLSLRPLPTSPAPSQPPAGRGLVLRLEGTSWLRITDGRDGRLLYEGTVRAGTELSYPLPVVVRAGNAGAVRVVLDGRDLGLMGQTGQVVTRRFEP
ncbi:helix-turn-helix domain-containing protein [Meiothermus sp. QL-1]|uniref:helix-turn-helix domain-containing protein n=1 Tax=Meiothermus sp. QL-1 TaxID=2058095 RepID=UPI000E0C71BF|nr:helix-turn-helix domain-containing protein [Meiothermus sp. QL-1]RDI96657.1 helix-turn-helix domain-containing protein [Meiothermus sp. QL-1]